uniref:Magnetosome protein MamI-3 n=1 Tax=delta proteobacterium ML-1 TaxID=947513 RepID=U5IHX6_9DELT|nr:magnetosome protein MamI-3 [delta proteobacterium ML-1]
MSSWSTRLKSEDYSVMSNGEPVDEILLTEGCQTMDEAQEADDDLVSDRMVVFLTIVVMTLVVLMVTLVVKNALKKPPSPQAMIAAAIKEWAPGQGPQPFMYHPAAQTQPQPQPGNPVQPDWRRLPQAGPVTAAMTAGSPAPAWNPLPGAQPNLAAGQIPGGSGSGPIRAYTGPTR